MPRQASTKLKLTHLEDRLTPAGWLDPNFGNGGIATTGLPMFGTGTPIVASQPDGKLLVAAFENQAGSDGQTSIVRLNSDGSVDSSFGTNGKTTLRAERSFPSDIEVTPSGDIYVLDKSGTYDAAVVRSVIYRLNANGKLDNGFDGDGRLDAAGAIDLAARADGSVLVIDVNRGGVFAYNAAGVEEPDFVSALPSFNQLGYWYTTRPTRIISTGDGGYLTIVSASRFESGVGSLATITVYKSRADGSLDEGYGTNGFATLDLPQLGGAQFSFVPMGIDSTGAVVIGLSAKRSFSQFQPEECINEVIRLTSSGQLDSSFAGDGIAEIGVPESNTIATGQILSDSRVAIVASGGGDGDIYLRVMTAQGTPDSNVADGGWLAISDPTLTNGGLGYRGYYPEAHLGFPSAILPNGRIAVLQSVDSGVLATVIDLNSVTPTTSGSIIAAGDPAYSGPSRGLISTMPQLPPVLPPIAPPPPTPGDGEVTMPSAPVTYILPIQPEVSQVPVDPVMSFDDRTRDPIDGDFNDDGVVDNVVTNGPKISVVSGKDGSVIIAPFSPFEAAYTGTLNYVVIDVINNAKPKLIIAPSTGGGGIVAVYDNTGKQLARFFGIDDANFRGGISLTVAAINTTDGFKDLVVTAGPGGGPRVAIFDGLTISGNATRLQPDFFAFESTQTAGVTANVTSDHIFFGAGVGGAPRVRGINFSMLNQAIENGVLNTASYGGIDRFVGEAASRNGVKLIQEKVRRFDSSSYSYRVLAEIGDGNPIEVANDNPPVSPGTIDNTSAGMSSTLPELTSLQPFGTQGLMTRDVVVGQGASVSGNQDVQVYYTGWLAATGTEFDSNREGLPTNFNLSGVIDGFRLGMQGMKPGGIRQILMPAALAYGVNGSGSIIPPNSDLVFEVKLIASGPEGVLPAYIGTRYTID